MITEAYLVFPPIEEEQAQVISLLENNDAWEAAVKYLQECLEFTIEALGKTENPRDKDMVCKGAKGTLEHVIELPKLAKQKLEAPVEEEEPIPIDTRLPKQKEEESNEV